MAGLHRTAPPGWLMGSGRWEGIVLDEVIWLTSSCTPGSTTAASTMCFK